MKNLSIILVFSLIFLSISAGESYSENIISLISRHGRTLDSNEKLVPFHNADAVIGYTEVSLSKDIINLHGTQTGDKLILNLFFDAQYMAVVDRTNFNVNGTFALRGRIKNLEHSYIIMSTADGKALAKISIPERNRYFEIIYHEKHNTHYLMEMDIRHIDEIESHGPLTEDPGQLVSQFAGNMLNSALSRLGQAPYDPAAVDIMIVYTPAASLWAQSNGGIDLIISQSMEIAQLVLDNSITVIEFNLVHSAEVSYVESGDSSTDLYRLTYNYNGHMDIVHSWRNTYGADLVALFSYVYDVGGIAWLLNTINGNPSRGFSITRVQQAANSYTHIHEVGHNMGAHHHKDQNFQPGPGIFNYSAGWRWTGTNNIRYCSVMTYSSGIYFPDGQDHFRVAYFSSPNVTHQGVPAGHAVHGDNARTLRETKHIVASYRSRDYNVGLYADPDNIGIILTGEGSYSQGTLVQIQALTYTYTRPIRSLTDTYVFTGWTGIDYNVELLDNPASPSTFFYMPSRDVEFTAVFNENGTGDGPDAAVFNTEMSYYPSSPMPGDTVIIHAKVRNVGDMTLLSGEAQFYYSLEPGHGYQNIGNATFSNIGPGAYSNIQIEWSTTPDLDPRVYVITVVLTDIMPYDVNPDNNTATMELALPVELSFFKAQGIGDTAYISWQTLSETDNLGFNLYRTKPKAMLPFIDQKPVKLNDSIIPGQGTSSGQHLYEFEDHIKEGGNYIYILESVSVYGDTEEFQTQIKWKIVGR